MNQVNIRAEKASKAFWAARDAWNEMRDKMKEMGLWNDWCEENDYTTMIEFDDLDLTGVL
jgi:isoleucyl-tRNA synthetase